MVFQAVLQNADKISYEKRLNEVWKAEFSLPADDTKNAYCQPFHFVEIFDAGERVDLFRILPNKFRKSANDKMITYSCEHVLSTLLDDILFQYHQTTNLSPTDTIRYILDEQSTERWVIGTVDFTALYSYSWENVNLLSALFSVPKTYSGAYMWTWDTTVYPWKLNLVVPPTESTAEIRYRKNLVGIERDEDPTYVITRLYPLGYGEGVNQLTIKDVNNGIPYIDADTAATYGIIAATFVDKTEENPLNLLAKAQAELEKAKIPQVTYSIEGADIYQITQDSIDRFREPGTLVTVYDEDFGVFQSRVITVKKPDIKGKPGDIQLEISTKKEDITDLTTNLLSRQRISEVNAQGATNIDSNDYQDNCDSTHPAIIKFYLPEETVRVNKCLLSYETDYFRAYERATKGGGATTETTDSGGSHRHKMFDMEASQYYTEPPTDVGWHLFMASMSATSTQDAGVILPGDDYDLYTRDAAGTHNHDIEIPNHTHAIDYGIYEFEYLPTKLTIKVDGTTVTTNAPISDSDFDIIPYLSKTNGKVDRGTFHTVEIIPDTTVNNPDGLARINASVVKQIFVQSRGGGDY
jgi:phage minor structural protein